MEWVEVEASSIEAAVAVAVEELGLKSVDEAQVEVLQEPEKGFLGVGRQDAIVRVKQAPKPKRQRSRGRGGQGGGGKSREGSGGDKPPKKGQGQGGRSKGGSKQGGGKKRSGSEKSGSKQSGDHKASAASGGRGDSKGGRRGKAPSKPKEAKSVRNEVSKTEPDDRPPLDAEEQARVILEFLEGLISAYGLEGKVETRIEEDVIYADVTGEQTEALVGHKGSILQSILELLKIVVQRKTQHRARIRLDIAGYTERRRAALKIYAERLTEQQVLADGGEVMLEPMNPADRKVIHDVVAEIDGARSWSEGEEPNRSVIIGTAPGFEPDESLAADTDSAEEASDEAPEDSEGSEERDDATDASDVDATDDRDDGSDDDSDAEDTESDEDPEHASESSDN